MFLKPQTYLIQGDPLLHHDDLQRCIREAGVDLPVIMHCMMKKNEIIWCRDQTAARFDGTHLLGFRRFSYWDLAEIRSLTPPCSLNWYENICATAIGEGIDRTEEKTEDIIEFLNDLKIPFERSHCPFDGGNILLFYDSQNRERAIIGFNHVVQTYVALENQQFYSKYPLRLAALKVAHPSEEAYYAARNETIFFSNYPLALATNQAALAEKALNESQSAYLKKLAKPLSPADRYKYFKRAVEIEKRFRIAQEEIAAEIKIENPIFLPNREFHVDLDILPLNGKDIVLYHDDGNPDMRMSVEKIERVLIASGLIPKPVVGLAKREERVLNLMNVLQIGASLIIPKSLPLFDDIDQEFIKALKELQVPIIRLTMPGDLITEYGGGLHCLTMVAKCTISPERLAAMKVSKYATRMLQ